MRGSASAAPDAACSRLITPKVSGKHPHAQDRHRRSAGAQRPRLSLALQPSLRRAHPAAARQRRGAFPISASI
ncbi:hypothetical protein NK6_8192 [Bradyrhizobium diazoefficiens]|uniref:Uncharacterized protein n=1 Tax=Bradyrhizobium diazoefficiens TaxID=1355477 RepID=A0A0E4FX81_9BRAD|nr:hypothetical protein NK6_8192 [Bradyrhizobium diazoefficiens]